MTTKPTPRERAVLNLWDDPMPIQFVGDEPEDEKEKPSIVWTLFLWACGLVAFCLVVALLVPKS